MESCLGSTSFQTKKDCSFSPRKVLRMCSPTTVHTLVQPRLLCIHERLIRKDRKKRDKHKPLQSEFNIKDMLGTNADLRKTHNGNSICETLCVCICDTCVCVYSVWYMCTLFFETRSLTKPGAYLFHKAQLRSTKHRASVHSRLNSKGCHLLDSVEMAQSTMCLPCKHEELS